MLDGVRSSAKVVMCNLLTLIGIVAISLIAWIIVEYLRGTYKPDEHDVRSGSNERDLYQLALEAYGSVRSAALEEIGDPRFTDFVFHTLDPVCPFFKPSGERYQRCLIAYIGVQKAQSDVGEEEFSQIEEYCQEISDLNISDNQAGELYLSCIAYKLESVHE